jgi:hypothetical protein
MNNTVGFLIEDIQTLYSRGVASQDSALSSAYIYSELINVRNFLVVAQAKKRQKISDLNYSLIYKLEMQPLNTLECLNLDVNCQQYKSVHQIPSPLSDLNVHLFNYVMPINVSRRYDEINRNEVLYLKGNKYTKNNPKFIFEDGHLYVLGECPKYLRVKYLSKDPVNTELFNKICNQEECDFNIYNYEFPIEPDLVEVLKEMVTKRLVDKFLQIPEDSRNDNTDNRTDGFKSN